MYKFKSLVQSFFLSLLVTAAVWQPSQAAMVGTMDLTPEYSSTQDIAVMREQIENQLVELGVEPGIAGERVIAMSDAQVTEINQRLSDLPAGADAGSVILTLFIVFVITDVIGATDIFPFIKPVK